LIKTIGDEMKMQEGCIEHVMFQGRPILNSASVAQLETGDQLQVRIKSNVDKQRKLRGKCNSCAECERYYRPEIGNNCDYCVHPVVHHQLKEQ
jgi:hypothetical protein